MSDFPTFIDFMDSARDPSSGRTKSQTKAATPPTSPPPTSVWGSQAKKARVADPVAPPAAWEKKESGTVLPRHRGLWISLDDTPEELDGLPPQGLVVSSDGKSASLYSQAAVMLDQLLGGDADDIILLHDDFNWEKFPQIGAELKRLASTEECMTVGVCPDRRVWAVGVAMKGKARWAAAKAALATAMAVDALDLGEELDFEDLPTFKEFVEDAQADPSRFGQ